jgi:hypothetical protein
MWTVLHLICVLYGHNALYARCGQLDILTFDP